MWPRGKTLDDSIVIGVQEGGLYKLKGHSNSTLVHNIVNPSELWHKRVAHVTLQSITYRKNDGNRFSIDSGGS
jgi:hypothetical protein